MLCLHDPDHHEAADFTRGASFTVLLYNCRGVAKRGRTELGAAEREFLSTRTIGEKAELPDRHKAAEDSG